jgi:hypothetical protein
MENPRLIMPGDLLRVGQDPRRLDRMAQRKVLTRVRRGAYVTSKEWEAMSGIARHGLSVEAFTRTTAAPPVLCRQSAALLWGLWVVGTPQEVHVLTADNAGGRSRNGIRRHLGSLDAGVCSLGTLLLTDKLRTTIELVTTLPFIYAVAVCDSSVRNPDGADAFANQFTPPGTGAANPRPLVWQPDCPQGPALAKDDLLAAAVRLPSMAARNRATAVINFSSGLSESAGESISRAQMHLLGFPSPDLQHKFTLRSGRDARSDFYFKEYRIAGEFDGLGKYLRADWAKGATLEQRIWAEKKREDEIRAQCSGFARWTWSEMMNTRLLERILHDAGLPNTPGRSPRAGNEKCARFPFPPPV